MSVVIKAELDSKPVEAGLKKIASETEKTGKAVKEVGEKTLAAGKQSAEGLGFVGAALGQLNPAFAGLGETIVKQSPTLATYAVGLKEFAVQAAAAAAIVGSLDKIVSDFHRTRFSAETMEKDSWSDWFAEKKKTYLESFNWMAGNTNYRSQGREEIYKERADIEKTGKMRLGVNQQVVDQMNAMHALRGSITSAEQADELKSAMKRKHNIGEINAEIKEELENLEKRAAFNSGEVVTQDEIAKKQALINALIDRRRELNEKAAEAAKAIAEHGSPALEARDEAARQARLDGMKTELELRKEMEAAQVRLNELGDIGAEMTKEQTRIENEAVEAIKRHAAFTQELTAAAKEFASADFKARADQQESLRLAAMSFDDIATIEKEIRDIEDDIAERRKAGLLTLEQIAAADAQRAKLRAKAFELAEQEKQTDKERLAIQIQIAQQVDEENNKRKQSNLEKKRAMLEELQGKNVGANTGQGGGMAQQANRVDPQGFQRWGGGGYQFAPTMRQFQQNQQGQGLRGAFGGGDISGQGGGGFADMATQEKFPKQGQFGKAVERGARNLLKEARDKFAAEIEDRFMAATEEMDDPKKISELRREANREVKKNNAQQMKKFKGGGFDAAAAGGLQQKAIDDMVGALGANKGFADDSVQAIAEQAKKIVEHKQAIEEMQNELQRLTAEVRAKGGLNRRAQAQQAGMR